MRQGKVKQKGFSLMELMITVSILAIVAGIAYPTYLTQVRKVRRSDAKAALVDLAARMERYYSQNNTYATATVGAGAATDVLATNMAPEGWYQLQISAQNASSFTLQAVPQNDQALDTECGTLSLNSVGVKGETGTLTVDDCW